MLFIITQDQYQCPVNLEYQQKLVIVYKFSKKQMNVKTHRSHADETLKTKYQLLYQKYIGYI